MKKLFIASVGICIFYSCAKKNVPTTTAVSKPPIEVVENNEKIITPPTIIVEKIVPKPSVVEGGVVAPSKAEIQIPIVDMKPTELVLAGEQTYKARCGKCHELKEPQIYNAPKWVKVVEWMGPRAKLDATQKDEVIAYLSFYAKK